MKTIQSNSIYDLRFTIYERLLVRSLVLLSLLLSGLSFSAHAAGPPEAMAYQGFLVDANGNPLAPTTPANYPLVFKIFATPTGGNSLWSEQQIVTVDKGNFSVILSEGTPFSPDPRPPLSTVLSTNGIDRYIEVSVIIGSAQPAPMLPRLRLLPMAYAFLASSANSLVSPAGVPVVTYANNRVELNGNIAVSGALTGNGSGLSGLTAAQIGSGTFADARLSANVALRAGGNTFSGNQTINGSVGIGGAPVDAALDVEGNLRMNLNDIFLREGADRNHGLGWFGASKLFGGVNPDGPVLYGFSGGGLGTKNGGDRLALNWSLNGNVGIGTATPGARLSLVAPGNAELQGSALSTTLRTTAGVLGTAVNNELALASIGFNSGNSSSLGIRAIRATAGGDWTSTAIGLGMDVDNTPRAGGAALWIHGNGNIGIGTTTPAAKLDVNGAIKASSITVNGTVSATTFTGTFNGEKAPTTHTIGSANLNLWRELSMDTSALLGDTDGGRIKVLLRDHGSRQVRTVTYEFYAENDADNFGQAWRTFNTVSSFGVQRYFRLGTTDAGDIASDHNWFWLRNYRSGVAFGGNDSPPENFANRYRFWLLVPPNISATVIVYDR